MMKILNLLLWILLLSRAGAVNATPEIILGKAENYCVVYCYIRVPFQIVNYSPGHKIGRVFCEMDAEVTAKLPVHNGEARTKSIRNSPIGVFKTDAGTGIGDVEISTGIIKQYLLETKVHSVSCHF